MSLTYNNLSDDWGWYIDIESMKPIQSMRAEFIVNMPHKKVNRHYTILETIQEQEQEDEYHYYVDNQKKMDDMMITNINKNINDDKNNSLSKKLFNIGSTTMITAVLTYIIFFML